MPCRRPHDLPPELHGLPDRAELHALGMPRHWRGEIDDLLLETRRLPGMRMLRIYVPAPELRGEQPLPLLLVNDGHKAFEPSNHARVAPWQQSGTLQLHRLMDGLLCAGTVRPAIVVAIGTHAGSRADQYVPVRTQHGATDFGGGGDIYLDVLQHEVLPAVERRLRTLALSTAAADRVLCGASIGGVSALYGALVRPEVFGGAIALSPSAWIDDGFLLRLVQQRGIASPRIAADIGASERTPIRDHCRDLFAALRTASGGRALAAEVDGSHNEDSWRARLPRLLQHVFGSN
ncbi:MAG: alpha/beta hydrolase-fold protein [Planctomycetes bacterium]|jgi:enterochelin esterase family protein|nr:alpha/beta hydrolase-fold protein [Planctomycetota bacterium]